MNAQELKHMARVEEWKGRVAECRSSGQSVRAWCREQGIAYKTYYYWEKEILSEAGRQMGLLGRGAESSFVELPALPERTDMDTKSGLAAKLRIGGGELEVYAGADERLFAALVGVLKDAE